MSAIASICIKHEQLISHNIVNKTQIKHTLKKSIDIKSDSVNSYKLTIIKKA